MNAKHTPIRPGLLKPKEAAAYISVSERKLWDLTHGPEKEIPHVKVGRLVRYAVSDLNDWINSKRVAPNDV